MLKATITIASGQTVTLEGEAGEIGRAISSLGSAPPVVKRGPGRPPKIAVESTNGISLAAAPKKPRNPVSPEVAKKRILQGQYLGSLRALSAADKKRVQKLAKEKGVPEALKEARAIIAAKK